MSRENVKLVWEVLEGQRLDAAEPGVTEGFVARLTPDVEYEEDPSFPEAGVYRGRSEVLGYFKQFSAQFERFIFEVEDVVAAGDDGVLVNLHVSGRGKGSGAVFDFRPAWHYTVRDGRVIRIRAYLDRQEALEAVGLRE
jgi:ketosteroid isomerase-like protein